MPMLWSACAAEQALSLESFDELLFVQWMNVVKAVRATKPVMNR